MQMVAALGESCDELQLMSECILFYNGRVRNL